MPLPAPEPRRSLHTRRIEAEGFRRDDGQWEVDARLVDTKPFAYTELFRGRREAGDAVHDIRLRLTVDDNLKVTAVAAASDHVPYATCQEVPPALSVLVGLSIGAGWRRKTREKIGRKCGCTHLFELLDVAATVIFQTLADGPNPESQDDGVGRAWADRHRGSKPFFVDGCKAWSLDGKVVATFFPEFAEPKRG
ncbi:MAG: DUF2889 domain-containing protein [Alphaproteobacteria bacterium]|nr:DUF2889 domain-containing protein [Alphaproteobacteria bacterium]